MAEEHPLKPFYSVLVLAFACSALVAITAVGLRPQQNENRLLDQKKNILSAAGILAPGNPVEEQFKAIETKIIELATGQFVAPEKIDPTSFNQLESALSDKTGQTLQREDDPAGIRNLEKYSLIYLVRDAGQISQVVLPVRGKGLWSTMYAYVAIDADLTTITGVSFYEHGETPGLGGEIANPRWQAGWQGKKIYNPDHEVKVSIVKSSAPKDNDDLPFLIDGISGATLTSKGVENLMQFWFGDHGFRPFLNRLKTQGGLNG